MKTKKMPRPIRNAGIRKNTTASATDAIAMHWPKIRNSSIRRRERCS